jgi:hypothetical protein
MISKFEYLARDFLTALLPHEEPTYNVRPDWLKNWKTRQALELDIYYPSAGFAVEVNGGGHYLRRDGSAEVNDRFKQVACRERGIKLYVVKRATDLYNIGIALVSPDWLIPPDLRNRIEKYQRAEQRGYYRKRKRSGLKIPRRRPYRARRAA